MRDYFVADDKILPTSQVPAALLELAKNSRMDIDELLRGTGIFLNDLSRRDHKISCAQLQKLITNIDKQDRQQALALRFGRQLPYINNSTLLQAIINAASIRDLLEILRAFCRLYYPMCYLHLASDANNHYLIVNDAIGCPQQQSFLFQSFISSLITLFKASDIDSHQLAFLLEHSQPQDTAPLQTYLGSRIVYNAPVTAVIIPDTISRKTLTNASEFIKLQALQQCRELLQDIPGRQGFIENLQRLLLRRALREDMTLQRCADVFGVSPATFKRRLKAHHTSFQQELDYARKLLALSSLVIRQMSNEETAHSLRINDSANFRRSFKRWTGFLPSALKQQLLNLKLSDS